MLALLNHIFLAGLVLIAATAAVLSRIWWITNRTKIVGTIPVDHLARFPFPWLQAALAVLIVSLIPIIGAFVTAPENPSELSKIAEAIRLLAERIPHHDDADEKDRSSHDDQPGQSQDVAVVAVPFGEASCLQSDPSAVWPGTQLAPRVATLVRTLGRRLAACGSASAPTQVQVRGFASASRVATYEPCNGAGTSDAANLEIANRREAAVAQLLREGARMSGGDADSRLRVEIASWANFEAMAKERGYVDTVGGTYDTGLGTFNRRVEIRLVNLAQCSVDTFKR
jgi:hypothetical protein